MTSDAAGGRPEGSHQEASRDMLPVQGVTPHLSVVGGSAAAAFYARAFGAVECSRMKEENGERLMICRLEINGAVVLLSDDFPEYRDGASAAPAGPHSPVTLHLQVEDCDRAFARAVEAGATAVMPPADMFWGDRYGVLRDPFGHHWSIAHTIRR